MVKIKGLKAFRPKEELCQEIASKPYDVLNSKEARQEAQGNPYSFLHVIKSEIDLPEDIDPYDEQVYQKAAENLEKMKKKGWLIQEDSETLYLYRQIMDGHEQYGLVVDASVQDYLDGKIKIHELTREKKEKDRINHVKTTNANTGPVFLTYRSQPKIDKIIKEAARKEPVYDFTAEDGVQHTLWIIKDTENINSLIKNFEQIPHTYVADGHHRSKSAAMVGQMRKEENPDHTGDEEYNWFLAVLFPHNQLQILDYNRVVKDLNSLSQDKFFEKVKENFTIEAVKNSKEAKPDKKHTFGMYLKGQWYQLTAKDDTYNESDPVEGLDVSILQNNLLTPVLDIGNPRKDTRIDFVGGIRGLKELEKRVDSGEMKVAFALYPTSVEELMSIADAEKLMPPKSTWFEPKLRSGLILHDLE
ncbi:MAG: DUF1015 family protein [Candidatus Marinimicrobia bacterium]|nr:DUF1015 family protein [Candidatus Neomarinimicrobiota bacterium]